MVLPYLIGAAVAVGGVGIFSGVFASLIHWVSIAAAFSAALVVFNYLFREYALFDEEYFDVPVFAGVSFALGWITFQLLQAAITAFGVAAGIGVALMLVAAYFTSAQLVFGFVVSLLSAIVDAVRGE